MTYEWDLPHEIAHNDKQTVYPVNRHNGHDDWNHMIISRAEEDRLVAINNGALRTEFTYDGFGRRVEIIEKDGTTLVSERRFVWWGTGMAEERDGANSVTKRFYAEGQINYQPSTLNLYYTRDHLGSAREVADWTA